MPKQAPATVPLTELSGVTLNVGDQKGGTESLLRAAGALDNLPYEVVFATFTSGPPQIEAATAGKIDFAITGNSPPVFGAASNARIKVVAAYDGGGVGDQVLVHADSPIRSIADLRGKRVAVGKGSSAHGHILGQLQNAGLTPADVSLVFLQPADALSAFRKREADAWAIWDPYTAQAEQQIPVRSLGQAKGVTNGYWFGIASDQALADPKRNTALQDLLVRFEKAARWAKDHPQQWAESYAAAVGPSEGGYRRAGPEPTAAHRTGRRRGGGRTEAGRPVRGVRADPGCTELRRLGRQALQRCIAAPADQHELGAICQCHQKPLCRRLKLNRRLRRLKPNCQHRRRSSSGFCPPTATADPSWRVTRVVASHVAAELPCSQPPLPGRGGPRR